MPPRGARASRTTTGSLPVAVSKLSRQGYSVADSEHGELDGFDGVCDARQRRVPFRGRADGYPVQAAAGVALSDYRVVDYRQFMKCTNIGAGDGLEPLQWEAVLKRLNAGEPPAVGAPNQRTTWLTTVNSDGSPHVTAVGALWLDGAFWFQTGAATGKARNVARDPRCAISTSIFEMDVVVEGSAERVSDASTVARLAHAWADQGWPVEPDLEGTGLTAPFNAPGLGPPPWQVYRIAPRALTAVLGVEPGGSTRFDF